MKSLKPFCFTNRFSFLSQRRNFHLHEYQNKEILKRFGLRIQRGGVANTPQEAFTIAKQLKETGADEVIVKSQVLAGGRGKGTLSSGLKGGVKICSTAEEARQMASKMIGYRLVTNQTTADGEPVEKVLVLEGVDIVKELYLAIVLDSSAGDCPLLIVSKKGGMDIEEVAKNNPNDVVKIPIRDCRSIRPSECLEAAMALGVASDKQAFPLNVADQISRLFDLFVKTDALAVEVNPLAVTSKSPDHVVCVDAKLNFDDNAAFRQRGIVEMEDVSRIDPREREASKYRLSFVSMNGNIGCVVNGAGLAMATMDIVKLNGGEPANFLDVGGGANVEQVTEAFKIVQSDPKVKVIFINIFGGIMRCDVIAEGLIEAAKAMNLNLPLVVRLVGNHVEKGKQLLVNSKIKCRVVDDFEEAAKTACQLAM